VVDLKEKKVAHGGEFEYCVLCWRRTGARRGEPVHKRQGYVEGVGQLCAECFARYVRVGSTD
jgi:hypothetical protein